MKCHGCCNDKVTADFTGKCHRGSVSPTLDSLCEDMRTNQRVTTTCTPPQKPPLSHYPTPSPSAVPSLPNCHKCLYCPLPSFFPDLLLFCPSRAPPPGILNPMVPLHINAIRIKNVLHNVIDLQNLRQLKGKVKQL